MIVADITFKELRSDLRSPPTQRPIRITAQSLTQCLQGAYSRCCHRRGRDHSRGTRTRTGTVIWDAGTASDGLTYWPQKISLLIICEAGLIFIFVLLSQDQYLWEVLISCNIIVQYKCSDITSHEDEVKGSR